MECISTVSIGQRPSRIFVAIGNKGRNVLALEHSRICANIDSHYHGLLFRFHSVTHTREHVEASACSFFGRPPNPPLLNYFSIDWPILDGTTEHVGTPLFNSILPAETNTRKLMNYLESTRLFSRDNEERPRAGK